MAVAPVRRRAAASSCSPASGLSGTTTAPAFQAPSSQTTNWGQLGSSSATRSPLATPRPARAAAKASLSRASRPWLVAAPWNSSAGRSGRAAAASATKSSRVRSG